MRDGLAILIFFIISLSLRAETLPLWDFHNKWSGSFSQAEGDSGQQVYRALINSNTEPLYIEEVFESPRSFNKKFVKVKLKVSDLQKLSGIELRLSSDPTGYENFFAIPIPLFTDIDFNTVQTNSWMTYTFTMGEAIVHGTPKLDQIIRLGFYIGGEELSIDFESISIEEPIGEAIVSFTFDDGYDDHYLAAQIMSDYGFSGTAYLMPRQVNQKNYLTTEQILEMKNIYGWDLSAHHKIPIVDFEYQELDNEMNYTLGYLNALGSEEEALHFAYPLGKQDRHTTLPLMRRTFDSARIAGGGAETLPPSDWHMLRTLNVLPSISPQDLIQRIKKAREQGEWLILMFHYLTDEKAPSNPLAYNTEKFREFCELLQIENPLVLTVNQVHKAFKQ